MRWKVHTIFKIHNSLLNWITFCNSKLKVNVILASCLYLTSWLIPGPVRLSVCFLFCISYCATISVYPAKRLPSFHTLSLSAFLITLQLFTTCSWETCPMPFSCLLPEPALMLYSTSKAQGLASHPCVGLPVLAPGGSSAVCSGQHNILFLQPCPPHLFLFPLQKYTGWYSTISNKE